MAEASIPGSVAAEQPAEGLLIAGEPDPLQRARNALEYVHQIAAALEALPEQERAFAAVDGRQQRAAAQQRAHTQLAIASALVAIAEQLQRLTSSLEGRP